MDPRYEEILSQVTIDTLERLAFIFASTEDEFEGLEPEDAEAAKVSFTGPFSGALIIAISKDALPELAGNMLGEDDEDAVTVEQQQDTLKETINIICGNLLPEISNKEAVFDIKAPETVSPEFVEKESHKYRHKIPSNLALDQGSCIVTLLIEDEILPALAEDD